MNARHPTHFGRYKVIERIGGGGMGTVYRASDPELQREVAVKVLRPEALASDRAVARFTSEARILARINDPHVVHVYDFEHRADPPYLVMEYVRGRSLGRFVAEGQRLGLRELIDCGSQMLAGLAVAHRQGVIHRDIKPGNVVLDDIGAYKLVDFGLAFGLDRDQGVTEDNCVVGTIRYLAPEVASGDAASPRSDLFATGLTLYEAIAGCPAYDSDNTLDLLRQVANEAPPPIEEACPWLPKPITEWFTRVLALDPAERFSNAEDAAAALADAADQISDDELERASPGAQVDPMGDLVDVSAPTAITPIKRSHQSSTSAIVRPDPGATAVASSNGSGPVPAILPPGPRPPGSTTEMFTPRRARFGFVFKLLLAIWLASSAATFVVGYMISAHALDIQQQKWRDELIATAMAAAQVIDGDFHVDLTEPEDMDSLEYLELAETLRRFMRANKHVISIYTLAKTGYTESDGILSFVVDAREEWDRNDNGQIDSEERAVTLGEHYNAGDHAPRMLQAFYGPTADDEITDDHRGTTLSGYAPIYSSAGQVVGIVGVDASGAHILELRDRFRATTLVMQLATLVAFLAAAGVVAIRLNRPVAVLQRALRDVAQGKLDGRVEVKTADEFRTLGDTINHMIDGLRERESLRKAFEQYLGREITTRANGGMSVSRIIDNDRPLTWVACDLGSVIGAGDDPGATQAAVEAVLGVLFSATLANAGRVDRVVARGFVAAFQASDGATGPERALRAALNMAEQLQANGQRVGIAVVHVAPPPAGTESTETLRLRETGAQQAEDLASAATQHRLPVVCPRATYHPLRHMFYADRMNLVIENDSNAVQAIVSVRGAIHLRGSAP